MVRSPGVEATAAVTVTSRESPKQTRQNKILLMGEPAWKRTVRVFTLTFPCF